MRGADCLTDHRLVHARLKLVIKPRMHSSNVPRKLNVSHLRDKQVFEELEDFLDKAVITCSQLLKITFIP